MQFHRVLLQRSNFVIIPRDVIMYACHDFENEGIAIVGNVFVSGQGRRIRNTIVEVPSGMLLNRAGAMLHVFLSSESLGLGSRVIVSKVKKYCRIRNQPPWKHRDEGYRGMYEENTALLCRCTLFDAETVLH